MKKVHIALFVLLLANNLFAQNFLLEEAETRLEEKFVYNVSWSFIHIGTISLITERLISHPGLLKITANIKTAPMLPFINIDEYNVALMRANDGATLYYYGKARKDGKSYETIIEFFESENTIVHEMKDFETGKFVRQDTLKYKEPFLVGTTLVNYARQCLDSGLVMTIPTLLEGKFYPTTLEYCGPSKYLEISNYDEPIRCFKYKGSADWEGNATAGVSGEFIGWISDDEDRVVIFSEMEILIGSIDIELVEWYKPGWAPPTNESIFTQTKR
jgi:hypothetical protein